MVDAERDKKAGPAIAVSLSYKRWPDICMARRVLYGASVMSHTSECDGHAVAQVLWKIQEGMAAD